MEIALLHKIGGRGSMLRMCYNDVEVWAEESGGQCVVVLGGVGLEHACRDISGFHLRVDQTLVGV